MFTVQLHNQALYHLSQLTTAAVAYRKPRTHYARKNSTCNSGILAGEELSIPLLEIKRQLHLDHPILCTRLNFPLSFISCKQRKRRLLDLKWRTSYVSAATFALNKQGIPAKEVENLLIRIRPYRHNHYCANNTIYIANLSRPIGLQVRHFKTDRSNIAETLRTPSLSARIKKLFPSDGFANPFEKTAFLGNDLLKNIDRLSDDEAQKVKVAFAEGYIAGQHKGPNKAAKLLKAIQNFLLVTLIIASLIVMLASASGTVFKLQLGSQVEVDAQEIDITFNDVKGADEAKQELMEVVEFLKNPEKFSALGGKLPKGVLLVGPPGTGKTLLARAVAGEAGVPFFHAAGSEFDEILVGQGARRVRDLFNAAKNRAPCVIFIDEIDAVGGKRTNSVLHPYANQTINQLLSEMDGFHQNEGVIVLGATNRKEDLDRALLRPGRFDVEVHVPIPDFTGRRDILNLYLSKIKCKDINVDLLARGTVGFTGADLENMVNLAAIRAAIDGAKFVCMQHLEYSKDKVLMGPERKTRIPDEEANEITAYHEGGHALVAYYTKDSTPIHKVTIIPRGSSLGHTAFIPEKEHYHSKKSQLLASMDTAMGGRAAEELIFGPDKITSGAASDLKNATAIATHMVKDWGMSEKAGLRAYNSNDSSVINVNELSPNTAEAIDFEIKKLLQDSYERAKNILKTHAKEHKQLAEALLKYETLEADDVKAIISPKKEEKLL